jgi:hypothetical protein
MRRKAVPLAARESHAIRLAWLVSFLATVALVAILGFARSAQAASVQLPGPLFSAAAQPFAGEEEEVEEEAEEEDVETLEECEEAGEDSEECEQRIKDEPSDGCLLRSAEATVLLLPARDRVQLTVRYAASSPAVVSLRYGLRGHRGTLGMGAESPRLGRKGVLRKTEKLSDGEMAKARAATEFDVHLYAFNTPGYCRKLFNRRLTSRHAAHGSISWSD